jgi:hypothetical protein
MCDCMVCKKGTLEEIKTGDPLYTVYKCNICHAEIPISKEYLKMKKDIKDTI